MHVLKTIQLGYRLGHCSYRLHNWALIWVINSVHNTLYYHLVAVGYTAVKPVCTISVSVTDGLYSNCSVRPCALHLSSLQPLRPVYTPHSTMVCFAAPPSVCDRLWRPVHVKGEHTLAVTMETSKLCTGEKKKKRRRRSRVGHTDTKAIRSMHINTKWV